MVAARKQAKRRRKSRQTGPMVKILVLFGTSPFLLDSAGLGTGDHTVIANDRTRTSEGGLSFARLSSCPPVSPG